MSDLNNFVVLKGYIPGEPHLFNGIPCQDAIAYDQTDSHIIMTQSDGVSGCRHSELGSNFLVHICIQEIKRLLFKDGWDLALKIGAKEFIPSIPNSFLVHLHSKLSTHLESFSEVFTKTTDLETIDTVVKYLQATLNIAIITNDFTLVAAIGDGFFCINGDEIKLNNNNKPNNLSTSLIYPKFSKDVPNNSFELITFKPTELVRNILIGSDGVADFNKTKNAKLEFNDNELQGNIYQFHSNRYLENPILVQRRLNIICFRNRLIPADDLSFLWAIRKDK